MTGLTCRSFEDYPDFQAMAGLLKSRPAWRLLDYPGPVDLQEMLGLEEIRANTRLWQDAIGRLAGFAILDGNTLVFEVASPGGDASLARAMIGWAAERLTRNLDLRAAPAALESSCREDDAWRRALLEQNGFVLGEEGCYHMVRSLDQPIPEPELPPGLRIRSLAGEAEAPAWVRLHRAGWGTENMTVEYKLAMMHTPAYDPELDLVAVAPEGSLAAYCVGYISEEENAWSGQRGGYLDPIVTHPRYQRRGLAKALMLAGLRLLRRGGMQAARLGTDFQNIPMQRAAQSVGFQVECTRLRYSRLVH